MPWANLIRRFDFDQSQRLARSFNEQVDFSTIFREKVIETKIFSKVRVEAMHFEDHKMFKRSTKSIGPRPERDVERSVERALYSGIKKVKFGA